MPLTQKGREILANLRKKYGSRAEEILYAGKNKGTFTGIDAAAGTLLIAPSGHALFLKRSEKASDHPGEWCCPGGSIEGGETPEQAAHRETQEETGYPVGDITQIDEADGFVTFRANVDAEFTPTINEEHTEARWAPLNDPPRPLHPGTLATLKKLLGKAIEAGKRESEAEKTSEVAGQQEAQAQKQAQALLDAHDAGKQNELDSLEDASHLAEEARTRETTKVFPKEAEPLLVAQDRREYDTNGWFTVYDNPLSKVGVYQYTEAAVKKGGDPRKMVGVYRSAEELGNEETVKSFRLMPWIDDHPPTLLGDKEEHLVPAEQKGVHGVIGEQTRFDGDTLYGNIKVFSESLAKKIASGKRELSLGYHCLFVPQEGVYKGEPYQYVQKHIRGNHNASVDKGRMGSEVRVLDSAEPYRFAFALDLKEPDVAEFKKRDDEIKDCVDAETLKFIGDSFGSLVAELEKKGYSKEYATKIAGKVAAEKGMTGHHDSTDSTGAKVMSGTAADADTKGDVKDPSKGDDPSKNGDLKPGDAKDRKAARDARDAKRSARDTRRAKDELSEEEEEAEDASEAAEDAEEEKEDEKDESNEARDRRSARDRRAGVRDWRKGARDKARAARDAKKGMDAAEVVALVHKEVAAKAMDATAIAALVREETKGVRKDAAAAQHLYQRISPVVGAFDHDEMSVKDVAVYGLKKLGQTNAAESADPVSALDCYLAALGISPQSIARAAQDSTSTGGSFIDKYLAA